MRPSRTYVDEAIADPHLAERDMWVDIDHSRAGRIKQINFPVKFSETPGTVERHAPLLGEHSREVLTELLGITEERFKELVRAGVTSTS